ncbi:MAG: hypothetical protein IPK77_11600 [Cellvibrio sp.]|jgi:hypothetical protein|nr:hypothetical protein [Cellvibrio sp.]
MVTCLNGFDEELLLELDELLLELDELLLELTVLEKVAELCEMLELTVIEEIDDAREEEVNCREYDDTDVDGVLDRLLVEDDDKEAWLDGIDGVLLMTAT